MSSAIFKNKCLNSRRTMKNNFQNKRTKLIIYKLAILIFRNELTIWSKNNLNKIIKNNTQRMYNRTWN